MSFLIYDAEIIGVGPSIEAVLLAILAMGFIFDRFGTKSDREQLQFVRLRSAINEFRQPGIADGFRAVLV